MNEQKTGSLSGKVALLTGGGSGLGLAIVRRYIEEDARVGILERSAELCTQLEHRFGVAVSVTHGDVRFAADNERAVAETVRKFGRLDIFVGNAGIYDNRIRLDEISGPALDAAFDELFSVNVKGYLLGARAALGELKKNRGCILFTASVSSFQPGFGGVLYVAAKHALTGITRQLAWELSPEVRVLLEQIGLLHRAKTIASQLAHGELRQLEVGLALATQPKLLLLDEPMAGMGPDESIRMIELIEKIRRQAAVLLVEHDMDAVFRLADRISVLVGGRIIATGTPDQIRVDPEVKKAYLGDEMT